MKFHCWVNSLGYGLNVQVHNGWLSELSRESRDDQHVLIVLEELPCNSWIMNRLARYEGQDVFASRVKCLDAVGDVSLDEEYVTNMFFTDHNGLSLYYLPSLT